MMNKKMIIGSWLWRLQHNRFNRKRKRERRAVIMKKLEHTHTHQTDVMRWYMGIMYCI